VSAVLKETAQQKALVDAINKLNADVAAIKAYLAELDKTLKANADAKTAA
jgi:hypothetical protein